MAKSNPLDAFSSTWSNLPADFRIPPLPKLSEAVSKGGFKDGLMNHEEAMEEWRKDLERTIVERIQAVPNAPAAAATTTATSSSSDKVTPAQLAAVQQQLEAHIDSDVVHGTQSPVVGESDAQNLDAKTIGSNQPEYGNFKAAINSNLVQAPDMLVIGTMSNLVIVGGLQIDGLLTVNGTLLLL